MVVLLTQAIQQLTPFWSVVGLSRGEREGDGRSSIRGNHMNLGGPTAAGSADGLGTVFFSAPVPSGWTWTMVLSSDTASSDTHDLFSLQVLEDPLEHAVLRPAIHAGVEGVPVAKPCG